MIALAGLVRLICTINKILGHIFSWFTLGIVLICFTVVVMRYAFSTGFVWMQDLYVWLNAMMFTGIAGYTLMRNGHVRVDIFYRPASTRRKAMVDLLGFFVFLLPFVTVIWLYSWSFVMRSWTFAESSSNAGGLQGLYVLKSFILVFCVVVGLQGLAMVGRSILVLTGNEHLLPEDLRYEGN
ncbi:TRAP transporter small permease subunit [Telmatospirillum sp. J64-1]|uniref:TRAP transporter small permease subunit n=1 Tax=Telmatospirillum sp. J64-1 TaxID=2502183 RepID=UPI00115EB0EE|nr:TRAP transporter small permease subunit [Telmatospirillum sp. J64-1]